MNIQEIYETCWVKNGPPKENRTFLNDKLIDLADVIEIWKSEGAANPEKDLSRLVGNGLMDLIVFGKIFTPIDTRACRVSSAEISERYFSLKSSFGAKLLADQAGFDSSNVILRAEDCVDARFDVEVDQSIEQAQLQNQLSTVSSYFEKAELKADLSLPGKTDDFKLDNSLRNDLLLKIELKGRPEAGLKCSAYSVLKCFLWKFPESAFRYQLFPKPNISTKQPLVKDNDKTINDIREGRQILIVKTRQNNIEFCSPFFPVPFDTEPNRKEGDFRRTHYFLGGIYSFHCNAALHSGPSEETVYIQVDPRTGSKIADTGSIDDGQLSIFNFKADDEADVSTLLKVAEHELFTAKSKGYNSKKKTKRAVKDYSGSKYLESGAWKTCIQMTTAQNIKDYTSQKLMTEQNPAEPEIFSTFCSHLFKEDPSVKTSNLKKDQKVKTSTLLKDPSVKTSNLLEFLKYSNKSESLPNEAGENHLTQMFKNKAPRTKFYDHVTNFKSQFNQKVPD